MNPPVVHLLWNFKSGGSVLACGRRVHVCQTIMTSDPKQVTCQKCRRTRRWYEAQGYKHPKHHYVGDEAVFLLDAPKEL